MINLNFLGSPKKFIFYVVDFDLGNQIEPILWCIFKLHTQTLRNTYLLTMNGITSSTIFYYLLYNVSKTNFLGRKQKVGIQRKQFCKTWCFNGPKSSNKGAKVVVRKLFN